MTEAPRPRGPGYVFTVMAVVGMGLLAIVTLTVSQPPPPTIAEFAPQAVERIEDAPDEQTSEFGSAEGGAATEEVSAPTPPPVETETPAIDVPRVRRCIGDPPRQIEDPQSPPCVPYWDGDNGAATNRGVTGSEIRVAWPWTGDDPPQWGHSLAAFFNQRFELYGRRIRLVAVEQGLDSAPETQRAIAAEADAQEVFASTFFRNSGGVFYHDELARRRVVSASGFETPIAERAMAAVRPYLWSYTMGAEDMLSEFGHWVCARLAGGNAVHAGEGLRTEPRAFGVILRPAQDGDMFALDPLTRALDRCGAAPADTVEYPATGNADLTNTMLRMSSEDVTSILCLCWYQYFQGYMRAANNTQYFPEWLASSFGQLDTNRAFRLGGQPPQQLEHTFGVSSRPRQVALSDEPFWWALRETDPDASAAEFSFGNTTLEVQQLYRSLLLLASGLQMAGPSLTPASFELGLQRTTFPNPNHPIMAGDVGFTGGSHAMTVDGVEWWFGVGARSPYSGDEVGSICYVDGGARHTEGAWPSDGDPFFTGECDSGA